MEGATQKLYQGHYPWVPEKHITCVFSECDLIGIKKGPHKAALFEKLQLFRIYQVAAAVLLPALLVMFGAERLLFAVADGLHAVGRNSS